MEIHVKLTIDDRFIAVGRWVAQRVTRKRLALALAAGTLGAAVVMAAPVERPHVFAARGAIRADEINESFNVLYEELNARVIRADMKIEVADCDALVDALSQLQERSIVASAVVTLELPAGTSVCPDQVVVDHPDGNHIRIVGESRAGTTLQFHGKNGIVIPMSRSLGLLDKMTLTGSGGVGAGVVVRGGASAVLGDQVSIREFVDGVSVDGGWLRADGVVSEDNSGNGFAVNHGGTMRAEGARATGNALTGFTAFVGSTILANNAVAEDNARYGFNANAGGVVFGEAMVATNNIHGFDANANGTIVAAGSMVNGGDRSQYGYTAWNDSCITAVGPEVNDLSLEGFSSRHGSYVMAAQPVGNDVTYFPSTSFDPTERSMVFLRPE
jgi:hypothetical protein